MLQPLRSARATLRTTPRRWPVLLVAFAIAVASAWASLAVTPAATIRAGVVQAKIKAAPGSGTVVRTALGRAVTDDTLNSGPLQLQVAVDVHQHPQVTEPQLLEALRSSRPRVIHAAVLYLVRLTSGALLLAVLVGFALLGRRPRRLLLVASTAVAVVGTGVGATAATTRLASFDAASCAHGWSRYAIADLPDLTPPAPVVRPPYDALAAANDDLIPVVLISDAHLNPEGLLFARALQRATGAKAVLDAGDTTSYGVAGEACVVAPLIRTFRVPYVWVRGNHDSWSFEQTMRGIRSVRVLDGNSTTVAGLTFFGVGDPSFTPRRRTSPAVIAANADRLRPTLPAALTRTGSTPDLVLVHECRMAESADLMSPGLAGSVPLVACGHTHRYAESTVDGTTVLHTGTVGAGGLGAFTLGGLRDFDAQLLFFSASAPHRLVRYYDVHGPGGAVVTFTPHDLDPAAVTTAATSVAAEQAPRPPAGAERLVRPLPRPASRAGRPEPPSAGA